MLNRTKHIPLALLSALLVSCGGGGDAPSEGFTVDSGVAQKGPLAVGSDIFINELSTGTYQPNGKEYTFRTNNNLGNFTPAGISFGSSYLSTLAQGYYFNEISGLPSTDIVNLSGLSQIGTGQDTVVNVNTLSSMAFNRTLTLATAKPTVTFAVARAQAQKELLKSFYIYNGTQILTGTKVNNIQQPANLTALDLSQNRAADQLLAAISGVVMTAGGTGGGVNALLSMVSLDLGDEGLLNNSPNFAQSVNSRLCAAAASTDFAAVAANLNRVYGTSYQATDLSQWMDTSGCVDQVINKYKFNASNLTVGTLSKSPAYVAGPDDVGQCFSVGGITTGASAGLYYKGGATPIVGTQKVVLGDSMTIGLTANTSGSFSGYIQRSAPAANGTCPGTVPGAGLTRVLKYTLSRPGVFMVSTLAGNGYGVNGDGTSSTPNFDDPRGVAVDTAGNIFVAEFQSHRIRKITSAGVVTTFAGTGVAGSADGIGVNATFNYPSGVAVDANGNILVADAGNHKIRKISASGVVSTLAGTGAWGSADGPGVNSSFFLPLGIAVGADGTVYVGDSGGNRIRKISVSGNVSTLAGTGAAGSADGNGAAASFNDPAALAVDAAGNVYVADYLNNKIRKITAAGVVSTLAGTGAVGNADGVGANASFYYPFGIAVGADGTVYVSDFLNAKIRKVSATGDVSTFAGSGVWGSADAEATTATLRNPIGIAIDSNGNIFFAESGNADIRKIAR